jgi:hypothetical protein
VETFKVYFQVERNEISYLRWVIESYDGLGFLKTIDPYQAVIELEIPFGCEKFMFELIDSLRNHENLKISPIELTEEFSSLI